MVKKKSNEATTVASQSRSRAERKKVNGKSSTSGYQAQTEFLKFITKAFGDIKDVSISIEGSERIPIKEIKKRLN